MKWFMVPWASAKHKPAAGKRQGERGITLIESVVTLTIVALVSTVIGRLYLDGIKTQLKVETRTELVSSTRRTVFLMEREIREIVKPEHIQVASSSRFKFLKRGTDVVDYKYEEQKLKRNNFPILDGLTTFQFVYERADGVKISTPADSLKYIWNIRATLKVVRQTETATMKTIVHPRNF
jgi:hypothetical protein